MGKFKATQGKNQRDSFFTKKKPYKSNTNISNKNEEKTSSGSFFVSTSEKQQILHGRENQKGKKKFKSNLPQENADDEQKTKKPFDKKKWRLQKYSKKYKLQQWEEKRKKAVLHQYYKQVKDDEPKFDVKKIYEQYKDEDEDDVNKQEETENENNLNRDIVEEQHNLAKDEPGESEINAMTTRKKKAFKKAHLEYKRIQEEKQQKKEEIKTKKAEKAEALKQYKQKKLEKYKKLNKKTKKGQPIMKYRMEMLLEQIQKSVQ
ncbi:hypothetical protein ILUMI_09561 [Ignelater luminosus]|uniref:Thyroid transcription factor 1-associated protein 26 n=1 Tax=Ignelater luminosus TaxID=2038154 RepID=A0A8K0CZI0_IGNLU|nr:hypothetical protein ILUMI_09561 [Ignelater luminosus]